MHDFSCSELNDMKLDWMKDAVRKYKETPKGVHIMSEIMRELIDIGRAEGRAEGIECGIEQVVANMILSGRYSSEEIAAISELPVERINEIRDKNKIN